MGTVKETALTVQPDQGVEVINVEKMLPQAVIADAAAIFGSTPNITKAQALRAALYLAKNDRETLGRDVYLSTTGQTAGQLLEGYRAVQNRITERYETHYRNLTSEEIAMHGVKPGMRSLIAEVTVYADAAAAKAAGVPYHPIIGITVMDANTRVPATKTLYWVLQKNARKDALRQMAGMPLNADEMTDALELAGHDVAGLRALKEEGKHFSPEQAVEYVEGEVVAQRTAAEWDSLDDEERGALAAGILQGRDLQGQFNEWVFDENPCPHCGTPRHEKHWADCAFREIMPKMPTRPRPNDWDALQGHSEPQPAATPSDNGKAKPVKAGIQTAHFGEELLSLLADLDKAGVPVPQSIRDQDGTIAYESLQYRIGAAKNAAGEPLWPAITDANLDAIMSYLEQRIREKAQVPA